LYLQKSNFGQVQYRLPDDGLHGPKHVGVTLKFLSPTNAPLFYTYKMLKYTVKISHDCSYIKIM